PGQRLQSSGTAVDVTASCSSTPCPTGIDLTLPSPAGMITGTVRSDTGQPIVGANVQVRNFVNNSVGGATTRRDGTFLVRGLPPGQWKVNVNVPGSVDRWYTPTGGAATIAEAAFVPVTAGTQTSNIDIALPPGAGSIIGTVTLGGQPYAGAVVIVRDAVSGEVIRVVSTADGAYEARVLASGTYKVGAFTTEAAPDYWDGKATRDAADVVTVDAPGTTQAINFALSSPHGTISGQVFMSDGVT